MASRKLPVLLFAKLTFPKVFPPVQFTPPAPLATKLLVPETVLKLLAPTALILAPEIKELLAVKEQVFRVIKPVEVVIAKSPLNVQFSAVKVVGVNRVLGEVPLCVKPLTSGAHR